MKIKERILNSLEKIYKLYPGKTLLEVKSSGESIPHPIIKDYPDNLNEFDCAVFNCIISGYLDNLQDLDSESFLSEISEFIENELSYFNFAL